MSGPVEAGYLEIGDSGRHCLNCHYTVFNGTAGHGNACSICRVPWGEVVQHLPTGGLVLPPEACTDCRCFGGQT